MANLDNIVAGLRARGLKVVETPGWITRGYAGQDLQAIRGVLWHHTATASARYNNGTPTLNMCINGRSDLPGPLCNIYFGRDGTVYMVATGVANHAGVGSAPGIPTNMGNHYLIGIEMESSGVAPWDWTPEQLYWAPRLGAALEQMYLQSLPESQRLQLAHYEYSSEGKIDPAGWPGGMDGLRNSINSVLASGSVKPVSSTPVVTPKPKPAPVAPKPTGKVPYCFVTKGDTGYGISKQFNVPFDKLQAYNPGVNWNALKIGQKIYLINWCRVTAGDTGLGIAKQMGVSFSQLQAWNPGVNWNALKIGQDIWLA